MGKISRAKPAILAFPAQMGRTKRVYSRLTPVGVWSGASRLVTSPGSQLVASVPVPSPLYDRSESDTGDDRLRPGVGQYQGRCEQRGAEEESPLHDNTAPQLSQASSWLSR